MNYLFISMTRHCSAPYNQNTKLRIFVLYCYSRSTAPLLRSLNQHNTALIYSSNLHTISKCRVLFSHSLAIDSWVQVGKSDKVSIIKVYFRRDILKSKVYTAAVIYRDQGIHSVSGNTSYLTHFYPLITMLRLKDLNACTRL